MTLQPETRSLHVDLGHGVAAERSRWIHPGPELVAAPFRTAMTHRSLDWPPLQNAFATLDSRKRRQKFQTETAVDIIQAAHDGVRVFLHLRRDAFFTLYSACQGIEILQLRL